MKYLQILIILLLVTSANSQILQNTSVGTTVAQCSASTVTTNQGVLSGLLKGDGGQGVTAAAFSDVNALAPSAIVTNNSGQNFRVSASANAVTNDVGVTVGSGANAQVRFKANNSQFEISRTSFTDYAEFMFSTGGSRDWIIGTRASSPSFVFYSLGDGGSVATIQTNGALTLKNSITATNGFIEQVTTKTVDYTASVSDSVILVNAATKVVTLPTAVGNTGKTFIIKEIANSSGTVTNATGAQNIDSSLSYSLSAQNKYVQVISDGAQWWVIASN